MSPAEAHEPPAPLRLALPSKLVYASGDHTVNLALSALALFYLDFLTGEAGLRPALAGAVPLVGRAVDAFTDPLMGRLSDLTRSKRGRRRPYFLIGFVPFGVSFALLWSVGPQEPQWAIFAYYTGVYVLFSASITVLSVPYLALIPEMALGYDERTSLNTFRSAGAVLGTLGAVSLDRLAQGFGGGPQGFAAAGSLFGLLMMLPWLFVYRVSFERPAFQRPVATPFRSAVRTVARHGTYRRLCAFFLASRIAVDLVGAMFVLFFTYWIGRRDDKEIALGAMLVCVVISLPVWLRVATHTDKRTLFLFGCCWWIVIQGFLMLATPDWPRWSLFLVAAVAGFGYAVADLMPWSMLGDVIDEDELATGERREGLYAGFFTFLRKLAGASGVAVAGILLDLAGFTAGRGEQGDTALLAIRVLTALVPALCLAVAAFLALGYPLGRVRHGEIRAQLEARSRASRERGREC